MVILVLNTETVTDQQFQVCRIYFFPDEIENVVNCAS